MKGNPKVRNLGNHSSSFLRFFGQLSFEKTSFQFWIQNFKSYIFMLSNKFKILRGHDLLGIRLILSLYYR